MASANICEICNLKSGRYTCPRCNILYCSTTCYQSITHNNCSESFFKDCVDEMLQSVNKDPKNKRDVEELLKRVNGDFNEIDAQLLDSDDDENCPDDINTLQERLEGVDLDDSELVWSKLSENERREYFEFLQNGEMNEIVEAVWKPFWGNKFETKIIEVEKLEELKTKCPKILKIKDFNSISNKSPSDCVQFNLINILASYAFTTRYFDGDHFKEAAEAVSCITQISSVFKSNGRFQNYEEAVKSVIYEYKNLSWVETSGENEKLLWGDLKDILEGPHDTEKNFYALCCLSDLSRLFKSALNGIIDTNKSKGFQNDEIKFETRDRIKMHIKKVDYYLSYVKDLF
nr:zinc finger HIT domain-containing protein 2 isoform X1 [Onthophagus taurus]